MPARPSLPSPPSAQSPATEAPLRVGFLLAPRFTLTAFAGFLDALRLAADEGDRSRPRLCSWDVLGMPGEPIASSSAVAVEPTAALSCALPGHFDYLVVVGGLLHGGQSVPAAINAFLRKAAAANVPLIGLCTGSFVLARAGLLEGHLACVSWFHREQFEREFSASRVVSNQMFVIDRDRLTCAGGTSVVHLAAALIDKHLGRAHAVKALRILIEQQPLPSRTLQPEAVLSERSTDSLVHKAMLMIEQQFAANVPVGELAATLGIGRRQFERRFRADVGLSPAGYRQRLRLERGQWLLANTDLDITEVAMECGYPDGGSFARACRKATGRNPLAIRSGVDERRKMPA